MSDDFCSLKYYNKYLYVKNIGTDNKINKLAKHFCDPECADAEDI